MTANLTPKPWTELLKFAADIKQIADHSPDLAATVLALPLAVRNMPRPELGTPLRSNRFYLGQRVQVTRDEFDIFGGLYCARAGDLGTVTNVPTSTDPDYGVVLDNNPTGKRHAFGDEDLQAAA